MVSSHWLRVFSFFSIGSTDPNKRAINTWFPYASTLTGLNKEKTKTRWLVLQKARRHPRVSLPLATNFQFSIFNFQTIY